MREVKQSFVFNSKLRSLHPAAAKLRKVSYLYRIDERLLERERKLEQARQNRIQVRNAS